MMALGTPPESDDEARAEDEDAEWKLSEEEALEGQLPAYSGRSSPFVSRSSSSRSLKRALRASGGQPPRDVRQSRAASLRRMVRDAATYGDREQYAMSVGSDGEVRDRWQVGEGRQVGGGGGAGGGAGSDGGCSEGEEVEDEEEMGDLQKRLRRMAREAGDEDDEPPEVEEEAHAASAPVGFGAGGEGGEEEDGDEGEDSLGLPPPLPLMSFAPKLVVDATGTAQLPPPKTCVCVCEREWRV